MCVQRKLGNLLFRCLRSARRVATFAAKLRQHADGAQRGNLIAHATGADHGVGCLPVCRRADFLAVRAACGFSSAFSGSDHLQQFVRILQPRLKFTGILTQRLRRQMRQHRRHHIAFFVLDETHLADLDRARVEFVLEPLTEVGRFGCGLDKSAHQPGKVFFADLARKVNAGHSGAVEQLR